MKTINIGTNLKMSFSLYSRVLGAFREVECLLSFLSAQSILIPCDFFDPSII